MDRIADTIRSQDQTEWKKRAGAATDPDRGAAELARINAALVELDAAAWAAVESMDVTAYIRNLSHTIIGALAAKRIVRDALIEAKANAARRAREWRMGGDVRR